MFKTAKTGNNTPHIPKENHLQLSCGIPIIANCSGRSVQQFQNNQNINPSSALHSKPLPVTPTEVFSQAQDNNIKKIVTPLSSDSSIASKHSKPLPVPPIKSSKSSNLQESETLNSISSSTKIYLIGAENEQEKKQGQDFVNLSLKKAILEKCAEEARNTLKIIMSRILNTDTQTLCSSISLSDLDHIEYDPNKRTLIIHEEGMKVIISFLKAHSEVSEVKLTRFKIEFQGKGLVNFFEAIQTTKVNKIYLAKSLNDEEKKAQENAKNVLKKLGRELIVENNIK